MEDISSFNVYISFTDTLISYLFIYNKIIMSSYISVNIIHFYTTLSLAVAVKL